MKQHALAAVLDRPIAFHRAFVSIPCADGKRLGVLGALMLSQAVYWALRTEDPDGWFWKTMEEWEAETGLSRYEQETARRRLRQTPFWQEERRGVPARMYYRVDLDALLAVLNGSPQSSLLDHSKLDCCNPANKRDGSQQTITENTTETTTKTTSFDPPERANARSGGEKPPAFPPAASPQRSPLVSETSASNDNNRPPPSATRSRASPRARRDPLLSHPAVQAWARATGTKPWRLNKRQRSMIAQSIPEGEEDAWARAVEHWLEHGWNPVNVKGQIEFYRRGGAAACKLCERGGHNGQANGKRRPFLPAREDYAWVDDEENRRLALQAGIIDENGNLLIELG